MFRRAPVIEPIFLSIFVTHLRLPYTQNVSTPYNNTYVGSIRVAVGPRVPLGISAYIENSQYSQQWISYHWATPNHQLYCKGMDVVTGSLSSSIYQINNSSLNSSNILSSGISSGSNSGDGLLCAWFNGTDIVYKLSGKTIAFKTSSIANNHKKPTFDIYPNPTTDKLNVSGLKNGSYKLTDITGSSFQSGTITTSSHAINVQMLSKGTYLLNVPENGATEHLKFIKE